MMHSICGAGDQTGVSHMQCRYSLGPLAHFFFLEGCYTWQCSWLLPELCSQSLVLWDSGGVLLWLNQVEHVQGKCSATLNSGPSFFALLGLCSTFCLFWKASLITLLPLGCLVNYTNCHSLEGSIPTEIPISRVRFWVVPFLCLPM